MLPPSAPPPPLPTKSEPRPRVPEAPHAAAPIESPQSPPARSWNQNESTVVLDLRRNPDSAVKLNGPGSRPANWSTELENCLKEKQKKQPIKRPVLKRGELEGLRERVQHPRGCELTTWVSLPYRVTRCRLRLFESGSGHGRKRPTLRQPLEGDLRSSHRPRLDLQDARSRTKDWWEDRSTFRSLARVKLTANEEREVTSRAIDPDCRHLVVWGGELSLTKSDSRTSSIEILVNSLMVSQDYKMVYGRLSGRAKCHASLPIDRREVPCPLKMVRSSRAASSSRQAATVCEFRSMFSSILESHRDRWNWVATDDSIRLPEGRDKSQVWTGVVEFETPVACGDFFDATTYTNVASNNLHSLPDYMGIKYWLHTILSTSIAASKVKPNRRLGQDAPRPTWWDSSSKVWAPFLATEDVSQGPWPKDSVRVLSRESGGLFLDRDQGVEVSGYCLRLCALPLSRGDETLTLVVHNESKPWVQQYLNITGMLPSQAPLVRIPKYIVQVWKAQGLPVDETHKYSTRVALLVFPLGRRLVISPALLCSRAQFMSAQHPWIVDRGTVIPPPQQEPPRPTT